MVAPLRFMLWGNDRRDDRFAHKRLCSTHFLGAKSARNHQLAGWNLSEKWNSYEIAASAWPLRA
jgi:hypothetical protein